MERGSHCFVFLHNPLPVEEIRRSCFNLLNRLAVTVFTDFIVACTLRPVGLILASAEHARVLRPSLRAIRS